VSPILVLTGLLALAYFASILASGRGLRGFGLPSGTEFVLIGIFVGPLFMGLISRSALASLEPIMLGALTWLALTTGVHYGWVGDRKVPARRMLAGVAMSFGGMLAIAAVVAPVAWFVTDLPRRDIVLLSFAVGTVSAETTRHAVRWVAQRYTPEGPVSRLIEDLAEADDGGPLLVLAVLVALLPSADGMQLGWPAWALVATTVAIGVVVGATCAALFDAEPRSSQRWGIVLGTTLLGVGLSLRLDLSAITTAFVMGVVASLLAKQRAHLHVMLASLERGVMLPALVLAGASVVQPATAPFLFIAGAALLTRFVIKLVIARAIARLAGAPRGISGSLAFGLMPAGMLTLTMGLACSLRFGGAVGDTVLALATVLTIVGELVGPAMLVRALRASGEIAVASRSTLPPSGKAREREEPAR
jgi:Kef-type K+ transport system membrane component KefB